MNKAGERLYNGLVKENPTFVLMLGMCPTLAVTTSAVNGLGMGLTTMVVLALSNLIISLLRNIIPNRVRIPAFIVIIASFVTAVQLLLEAYIPALNKSLGVYIPLIVVNCIILGRAESYAYSNPPVPSLFDGIGMGLGFTFALTCIGAVRELIGAGELFGFGIMPDSFEPVRIFGQAPGAFFVLAALVALQNYIKNTRKKQGKPYEKIGSGCSEDCSNCGDMSCKKRFYDANVTDKEAPSENPPKEKRDIKATLVRESGQVKGKNDTTVSKGKDSTRTDLKQKNAQTKEKDNPKPAQVKESVQEGKKDNTKSVLEHEKGNAKPTPAHENAQTKEKGNSSVASVQKNVQEGKEVDTKTASGNPPETNGIEEESLVYESLPDEDGDESMTYESLPETEENITYESLADDSEGNDDSEESLAYESLPETEESYADEQMEAGEKVER